MKKLCVLAAIVCFAAVLFSSCGTTKRKIAKLELYVENDVVHNTFGAETMEGVVKCFAETAPELYDSEAIRQVVDNNGKFYIPDNGDEIISYALATHEDDLTVLVKFRHGDVELCLVKSHGDKNVPEMKVGDKSVYYRTDEIDGEDIITSIFYRPEDGELLQIFKVSDSKVDKSIQFTKEEISALGEDFFNFKSDSLKNYFDEDYFAEKTE